MKSPQCMRQLFSVVVACIVVPSWIGTGTTTTWAAPLECQGLTNLCSVPVSEVYFAMVHNAMSSVDNGFIIAANHMTDPIVESLDAGYRALNVDICKCGGDLELCHGSDSIGCGIGRVDPVEAFTEVKDWVEANPRNVLLLSLQINEEAGGDITLAEVKALLDSTGLSDHMYDHWPVETTEWPTVGELIDMEKQVVFFYFEGPYGIGEHFEGLNYLFDVTVATGFDWESVSELEDAVQNGCPITRGQSSTEEFFMMEAFVTETGLFGLEYQPSRDAAKEINTVAWAGSALDACYATHGIPVNIVSVDFWSEGNLPTLMQQRNALLVGTTSPPTKAPTPNPTTKPPTMSPTTRPPTASPTEAPTQLPTTRPTPNPTSLRATPIPTEEATTATSEPSASNSATPSLRPSHSPTKDPTPHHPPEAPTLAPTTSAPFSNSTPNPTEQTTVDDENVCTLQLTDGTVLVLSPGESYGSHISTQCGSWEDFPCFCNPSVVGQVECPYCGIRDSDDTLHCAAYNETTEFVDGENFRSCFCESPQDLLETENFVCQDLTLEPSDVPSMAPSSASSINGAESPSSNETSFNSTLPSDDDESSAVHKSLSWFLGCTISTVFFIITTY